MEPVSGNRRERRAHQAAPPKPKGSRRTIALSPSLAEELPTRYRPALVFAGIDGDPIQPGSVTRMFARIVGRTKIRPISFHGLRHSNATDLLRAVCIRRSRRNASVTRRSPSRWTYSHAIPGLQEGAAQRIDAALRNAISGTQGGKWWFPSRRQRVNPLM